MYFSSFLYTQTFRLFYKNHGTDWQNQVLVFLKAKIERRSMTLSDSDAHRFENNVKKKKRKKR